MNAINDRPSPEALLQDAHLDPDDLMEDLTALNSDQTLATLALYEGEPHYIGEWSRANAPAVPSSLHRMRPTKSSSGRCRSSSE